MVKAISVLDRKLRWAWYFSKFPREEQLSHGRLIRTEPRRYNREIVPAELDMFLSNLKYDVRLAYKRANARIARRCHGCSNMPNFAKHALAWIRSNGMSVVPSDKDGGFVLLASGTLSGLITNGMEAGHYRAVADDTVARMAPHIRRHGFKFCERLEKLGYTSWAAECRERISGTNARNTTAVITCTVETHKPAGQVVARILHASVKLSTEGLSAVIHRWLDEKIRKLPHIAVNSEDLISKVQAITCTQESLLLKLDIADFFMDGSHEDLIQAMRDEFAEDERATLIEDILEHLLFWQYVTDGESCWQVMRGSGMGGKHSGSLADLSFYRIAEHGLNWAELGVLVYVRFGDVLFVVVKAQAAADQFVALLSKRASRCWKIKLESSSTYGAQMLDVYFYKGPQFLHRQVLDFAPWVKPPGS